jgi:hypothetical protein
MSMADDHGITYEELADLADPGGARLSGAERARLLARAAADPAASAELARLRSLIQAMRDDTAEDAPGWAIARAVQLFQQRDAQAAGSQAPAAIAQLGQLARRIVAVLQFDSAQSPLAYGVRGAGQADGRTGIRQFLYGAEDRAVDVRIEADGPRWRVRGQLLSDDAESGGSAVLRNENAAVEAPLSSLCEFNLPPVPAGLYELIVRQGSIEVAIPVLALEAGPAAGHAVALGA